MKADKLETGLFVDLIQSNCVMFFSVDRMMRGQNVWSSIAGNTRMRRRIVHHHPRDTQTQEKLLYYSSRMLRYRHTLMNTLSCSIIQTSFIQFKYVLESHVVECSMESLMHTVQNSEVSLSLFIYRTVS